MEYPIVIGGSSVLRAYNPKDFSSTDMIVPGEVCSVYNEGHNIYSVLYDNVSLALTYIRAVYSSSGSLSYESIALGTLATYFTKKPTLFVFGGGNVYVLADVLVGGKSAISSVADVNRVDISSDMGMVAGDRFEITGSVSNDREYIVSREDGLSLYTQEDTLDVSDNSGFVQQVKSLLFKIEAGNILFGSTDIKLRESEIIGGGYRSLVVRHKDGTAAFYWRDASVSAESIGGTTEKLKDIIKHRGFMFALSQNGLYGYKLTEELFSISSVYMNVLVEKLALMTNGVVLGYTNDNNRVIVIDPTTGVASDLITLDHIYSVASVTAPDQVTISGAASPISNGSKVKIVSSSTASNNGVYIISDNTGHPVYKVEQILLISEIKSPDTVMLADVMEGLSPGDNIVIASTTLNNGSYVVKMVYGARIVLDTNVLADETPVAGTVSKVLVTDAMAQGYFRVLNEVDDLHEFTVDRYSRFLILDKANNVLLSGNRDSYKTYSVPFQITSFGKNLSGMDPLFYEEVSSKYHTEMLSDSSSFSILGSMSSGNEGVSMLGYLGTEKLYTGESAVYTNLYVLGINLAGRNDRSFTAPSTIKDVSSDLEYIWVLGESSIWVLSIKSFSVQTQIDITKNNSVLSFPTADRVSLALDMGLEDGTKMYITGANDPNNDGEWVVKLNIGGGVYSVYTDDKSFVPDVTPGGNASIYNLGEYISAMDDDTAIVFNSNYKYDVYGFSGGLYRSAYLEYPDAGSTADIVDVVSSTAPNTFAFDHDPVWTAGQIVEVVGSLSNDGVYTISSNAGSAYVMVEPVVTGGAGGTARRQPTCKLKISDSPKYNSEEKNVLVPIKSSDNGSEANIPAALEINRGGVINNYIDIMIPWGSTYRTRVMPFNDGYKYLIADIAGVTTLHEIDPALVVTTYPMIGSDYGSMSVGPYGDLMVFKTDDVGGIKGLFLYFRDPGVSGVYQYYSMNSAIEIEGYPGRYIGTEFIKNAMGYSVGEGNFMSDVGVETWAAFDYKSNTVKFITTGISYSKAVFNWNVSVKLLIDNSQELILYLSPINQTAGYSGNKVFSTSYNLGSIPSVVLAEFIIEDKYSGSIINKYHIMTFGRR